MILLSPYSRPLRNGEKNPKNYPMWKELVSNLDEFDLVQVGVQGEEQLVPDMRLNLSLPDLGKLVDECQTWISVDSFFQHFAWDRGKYGVVLWGQSDPVIFGHPENHNLLKDRSYLREKQFWLWEQCTYRTDCWVEPEKVVETVKSLVAK